MEKEEKHIIVHTVLVKDNIKEKGKKIGLKK